MKKNHNGKKHSGILKVGDPKLTRKMKTGLVSPANHDLKNFYIFTFFIHIKYIFQGACGSYLSSQLDRKLKSRFQFQTSPGKKTLTQWKKLGMVGWAYHISYCGKYK
jgi:hypothetical protein